MSSRSFRTFGDLVRFAGSSHGSRVFLPRRHARGGEPITFAQLAADVRRLAAGLLARGVGKGDRVGLIAENRYEWLLCDLACSSIGAVDVPRGTDTSPQELSFILGHAGCRFAFVETQQAAQQIAAAMDELPELRELCVTTEPAIAGTTDLAAMLAAGDALLASDPGAVDRAGAEIGSDDLLTVIYTSGTTANPKGVMLTHHNVLENLRQVEDTLRFHEGDVSLSILPAWHAYERIMDYVLLYAGAELIYSDRRRLKEDLRDVRPTIFVAVPRVWEMLHDGIVNHVRKLPGRRGRLLVGVLDLSRRIGSGRAGVVDRLLHALARRLVLPKLLAATGGRIRLAVSGGGALPRHIDERMLGIGLPLLNGYGLTETSPVLAVRVPEDNRAGTIGHPIPNTDIEIRDGEGRPVTNGTVGVIWCRGPQIMRGYYRNAEATAAVLIDGWLNTGDLGRIEPDGHIAITGRAKDTIVLSGGENVEPEPIETALKTSAFIDQAVVLGQDQKTLGAILVPSLECLELALPRARWGEVDGELTSAEVTKLFRTEIDTLLSREQGFRPVERVASFRLITEPLTAENGLLTQTMKVKRHVVNQRYAPLIATMFPRDND